MTHSSLHSLTQAVEAYYDELQLFVRKRTGSSAIAEEVVQETWIRASTLTAELPDNPRAYLYRMAGNLAVDQIRRERGRGGKGNDSGTTDETDSMPLESFPCPSPGPLDTVLSQHELSSLNAAVRELPDKCREVF